MGEVERLFSKLIEENWLESRSLVLRFLEPFFMPSIFLDPIHGERRSRATLVKIVKRTSKSLQQGAQITSGARIISIYFLYRLKSLLSLASIALAITAVTLGKRLLSAIPILATSKE